MLCFCYLTAVYSLSVYDITKRSSFLSVQRWMEEVRRYTHQHVAIILIGELLMPSRLPSFFLISFEQVVVLDPH